MSYNGRRLAEKIQRPRRTADSNMQTNYVIDMDGVIYLGNELLPGAKTFIDRLVTGNPALLF